MPDSFYVDLPVTVVSVTSVLVGRLTSRDPSTQTFRESLLSPDGLCVTRQKFPVPLAGRTQDMVVPPTPVGSLEGEGMCTEFGFILGTQNKFTLNEF